MFEKMVYGCVMRASFDAHNYSTSKWQQLKVVQKTLAHEWLKRAVSQTSWRLSKNPERARERGRKREKKRNSTPVSLGFRLNLAPSILLWTQYRQTNEMHIFRLPRLCETRSTAFVFLPPFTIQHYEHFHTKCFENNHTSAISYIFLLVS